MRLSLLLITLISLQGMAGTFPPKNGTKEINDALERCGKELGDVFWITFSRASENASQDRREWLDLFYSSLGPLTPIEKSIKEGPITSSIAIRTKGVGGILREAKYINWYSRMGTKTAVEFPDESVTVPQIVTGIQYLQGHEVEAVRDVVAQSFPLDSIASFQQSGVFIIKIDGKEITTAPFQAKGASDINFKVVKRNLAKALKKIKLSSTHPNLEITFIHTHEGEGTPLDANDVEFLKSLVTLYPGVKFKIIAVPAIDHGYVAFEMESA
jgi:hypothetical protein